MQTELTTYHYQLADIFGNISITTLTVTSMTIFLILSLIFIIMVRWEWQTKQVKKAEQQIRPNQQAMYHKPNRKKQIVYTLIQILMATGIICSAFITIAMLQTEIIAKKHGMYQTHMPYKSVITGIENTPEESILPHDESQLANSIIIYYKFGCEDCEAVYTDLQNTLSAYSNIYWVSTRSEQGQKLRKTYPVSNVPTIAYITERNTAITAEITNKSGEQVTLNHDKLQEILDLYSAVN